MTARETRAVRAARQGRDSADAPAVAVDERLLVAGVIGSNILGSLPLFLLGGVSVYVRDEFSIDRATLGLIAASYPTTVAIGSIPGGRLVNRLGSQSSMIGAGIASVVSMALVWTVARSPAALVACLVLGGIGQSLCAPAADVVLSQAVSRSRHGLAYGFKQAAIPLAALLSGLAVPALAVPFGWRSAFAVASVLGALIVVMLVRAPRVDANEAAAARNAPLAPAWTSTKILSLIGLGAGLGTAAGTAVSVFLVDAAQDAGLSASRAGLLLTIGGAASIGGRVLSGHLIDRVQGDGIRATSLMLMAGGLGYVVLASGRVALYDIGALVAFGAGWGWGGLLRYGVARIHSVAPGAAMGIVNAALAIGGLIGPLGLGAIVDATSFSVAWLVAGGSCVIGGLSVHIGGRLSPSRTFDPTLSAGGLVLEPGSL